jgi:hypothetical protein
MFKEIYSTVVYLWFLQGMTCRGGPEFVIANGRVTVDEGQVKAVQGYGSFIPTPAFAPFVYDAVAEREKVLFRVLFSTSISPSLIVFFFFFFFVI